MSLSQLSPDERIVALLGQVNVMAVERADKIMEIFELKARVRSLEAEEGGDLVEARDALQAGMAQCRAAEQALARSEGLREQIRMELRGQIEDEVKGNLKPCCVDGAMHVLRPVICGRCRGELYGQYGEVQLMRRLDRRWLLSLESMDYHRVRQEAIVGAAERKGYSPRGRWSGVAQDVQTVPEMMAWAHDEWPKFQAISALFAEYRKVA